MFDVSMLQSGKCQEFRDFEFELFFFTTRTTLLPFLRKNGAFTFLWQAQDSKVIITSYTDFLMNILNNNMMSAELVYQQIQLRIRSHLILITRIEYKQDLNYFITG